MVFFRGILSFTELRLFLKDIGCTNIVPFDEQIIQVNELYPVVFYKLQEADDYKMFIDAPELIHVLYLPTYSEPISLAVDNLMETPINFVLVIGEYVKDEDFVDEFSYYLPDFIKPIYEEYNIIRQWETLLLTSTDNLDTKRDAKLKELYAATREQLKLKNNSVTLAQKILEVIQKDSKYILQSKAAYAALNDAVVERMSMPVLMENVHPPQPATIDSEVAPPVVDLAKPPVLSEVSLVDHAKKTKASTTSSKKGNDPSGVANDRVDVIAARNKETELNKLKDYVSLFISTACGSVGIAMVDAFVDLPNVNNILHNRRAYEAYLNALTPTVKYAIQRTDGWILTYSANNLGLYDVVTKFYESTSLAERQIYLASAELCGQLIKNGHLENPKRGMQTTRFNIPSTLRNMSDALDVFKNLLPHYHEVQKKPRIEFSNLIFKD